MHKVVITNLIKRKGVLPLMIVLGSGGFIGKHASGRFPSAVALSRTHLDLGSESDVREYFSNNKFKTIIHCGAVGGSRLRSDDQRVFDENVSMFLNVYRYADFERMIWFSSGAAELDTPYGRAKKHIEELVKNDERIFVIKIWGCFGPGEPSQRLLATGMREGHVNIHKDKYFDFVHVRDVMDTIEKILSGTEKRRFVHMIYDEKHHLLTEILDIAGIPYTLETGELDAPYTGTPNEALGHVLTQRIREYVMGLGSC